MVSTFPKVNIQICRYADGTVDELEVPRGTTAFVRGKTLFDILPKVRSKVRYAPHLNEERGFGASGGLEDSFDGKSAFPVYPCAAAELIVDPLPAGASKEGALYPDGAHITELKKVRDMLYKMQGPAIAPKFRTILSFSITLVYVPNELAQKDDTSTSTSTTLYRVRGRLISAAVRAQRANH
ncbi:hypothetical protein C8R42DRAFT_721003 [Lentinula raphanica]|nr:hypothetical protein C8R42DRAFT_721003 [Lentinula raphanica]